MRCDYCGSEQRTVRRIAVAEHVAVADWHGWLDDRPSPRFQARSACDECLRDVVCPACRRSVRKMVMRDGVCAQCAADGIELVPVHTRTGRRVHAPEGRPKRGIDLG